MPFSINPDLIENNDVEIQTVDGELALFHKPSGNTLIVDEDTSVSEKLQSPLRDNVDLDGNDLISGGSGEFAALEAESISKAESYTSVRIGDDQNIPDDTVTQIELGRTIQDKLGITDFENDRLIVEDDGSYLINGFAQWREDSGWSTGDVCGIRASVAGDSSNFVNGSRKVGDGREYVQIFDSIYNLNEGDEIFFECLQRSGETQTLRGDSDALMRLNVVNIG